MSVFFGIRERSSPVYSPKTAPSKGSGSNSMTSVLKKSVIFLTDTDVSILSLATDTVSFTIGVF